MRRHIDKDVLVAEIEKRRDSFYSLSKSCEKGTPAKAGFYAQAQTLEGLLSFLDTLEVKEVDVEKESELIANSIMISVQANLYHTNVYNYEKRCYKHSDLKDAARKGIELGLKTQKGE